MSDATTVRGVRRAMIVAVTVSLAVAALLGIVALLAGGVGETERNVLYTTLIVGGFGTAALCHLAVVTRPVRAAGFAGLVAGLGATVCALVLIWGFSTPGSEEALLKTTAVLAVVTVSLAQTNLLLLLASRAHRGLRIGLALTVAAIAVVGAMLVVPVLAEEWFDDPYTRLLGIAMILDALGTIAVPIAGLVLRRSESSGDSGSGNDTVRLQLDLPADLVARLDARAGTESREAAALEALARAL